MKNQADQTPEGMISIGETAAPVGGAGSSRRRFIKGGAAAAPVILTFTSRPVLGFEQACMTPSRMISGNHSGFTGPTTCGGNSRDVWAALARLPSNSQPPWTGWFFTGQNGVFGNDYPYEKAGIGSNPNKLGPVLLDSMANNDGNSNAPAGFASYVISAYLNAYFVQSVGTVLKTAQVVHMWNDVVGSGAYCPQPNMCWSGSEVIGYLQNSGIVPS